jgi:hypothetical protein
MDFNALKEKYGDNEGLMSDLSQIESAYTTLEANKQNAVDEVKKFKGFKHAVAETIGLDREISIDDLQGTLQGRLSEFQQKIDSFKNNASSKEIENASLMEQINSLTNSVKEIKGNWEKEQATTKLLKLTQDFTKALNEFDIVDPNAVDIALKANLNNAQSASDLKELAKSIAEANPFLTKSVHKGGAGSKPPKDDITALAEKEIKYGMPSEEEARILKARRELKKG